MIILTVLEYGVLLLLLALSIWSISIMIDRRRAFSREAHGQDLKALRASLEQGDQAAALKWSADNAGLHAGVLRAALSSSAKGRPEAIDPSVRAYLLTERPKYEKGLAVLATLGSNAPFIGLFGTVLGIIRAFAALGDNAAAGASVMSGISLALIATAAGLFVAIPAVIAFNSFSNRWKSMLGECDALKEQIIAQTLLRQDIKRG